MPTPKFSEEELATLSDEEREGMLEDIDNGDDEANDELDAGGDTGSAAADADISGLGVDPLKPAPVVAADAGDAGADGKPAPAVVPDPAAAAAAAAAAATVVVEGTEPASPAVIVPKYEAPAASIEKVATLQAELDALAAKFDDGELGAAEYRAQTSPLEAEVRKLERVIDKAQDVVATWTEVVVPSFFESNPKYKESAAMYAELDKQVRIIQAESLNPFDPSILPRAHKLAVAEMRKAIGLAPEDPATPAPKTPGAKRDLPPNLANVPASDITDTVDNSEFAYLDRLQEKPGTAFEDALAKLTDEQHARYLAAG